MPTLMPVGWLTEARKQVVTHRKEDTVTESGFSIHRRRLVKSLVGIHDAAVAITASLLRSQIDIVEDRGIGEDAGAVQRIQRELDELALGAAPTNDQRYAVHRKAETDCLGKAEDRRQVDYDYSELLLQAIDQLDKSLEILARPGEFDRGAPHKVCTRSLFDGDNVVRRALASEKISQGKT